jgi:hypothetical protein
VATLEDLEARVAALEAERGDYKAVLAAVNALGANQREHSTILREHSTRLDRLENTAGDTNRRVRSLEEGQAEIKDLLVRALDK